MKRYLVLGEPTRLEARTDTIFIGWLGLPNQPLPQFFNFYALWGVSNYSYVHLTRIFRQYIMILRCVLVFVDSSLFVFSLSPNSTVSAPNIPSPTLLYVYRASSYAPSLILAP